MNELKVFTLEEANELIPHLTELLHALQKVRNEVNLVEAKIDALELIADQENESAIHELNQLMKKHQELVSEFYGTVDEIHSHECFLKDVDRGLIDFYGAVGGKVVYLCWRLGEDEVGFWHEIGKGYANREPLSASNS